MVCDICKASQDIFLGDRVVAHQLKSVKGWGSILDRLCELQRLVSGRKCPNTSVLWKILMYQARFNSPLFASHGVDHSMRVAQYAITLMETPQSIFYPSFQDPIDQLTMIWTALLHDVGYIELELCQPKGNQTEHAAERDPDTQETMCPYGDSQDSLESMDPDDSGPCAIYRPPPQAEIRELLCESKSGNLTDRCDSCTCAELGLYAGTYRKLKYLHAHLGRNLVALYLQPLVTMLPESKREIMLEAIEVHNADSDTPGLGYIPDMHGRLYSIGESTLASSYRPASVEESPILALLRLTDNLDMTQARLSPEQRCPELIRFQLKYSVLDREPTEGEVEETLHDIQETDEEGTLCMKTMRLLLEGTNPREFQFQYSNWIIERLDIHLESDKIGLLPDFVELLEGDSLHVNNHGRESMFQFTRLLESMSSITYRGEPLEKYVYLSGPYTETDRLER